MLIQQSAGPRLLGRPLGRGRELCCRRVLGEGGDPAPPAPVRAWEPSCRHLTQAPAASCLLASDPSCQCEVLGVHAPLAGAAPLPVPFPQCRWDFGAFGRAGVGAPWGLAAGGGLLGHPGSHSCPPCPLPNSRRYKICMAHSSVPSIMLNEQEMRWCQQVRTAGARPRHHRTAGGYRAGNYHAGTKPTHTHPSLPYPYRALSPPQLLR